MWVSEHAFRRGLHEEHHDELAFLYRQTARLREEGELPLDRLVEFERRLVAHLDALNIGGAAAWRDLGLRHDDDDPGHWYAAALLACAQGDERRFGGLLERARSKQASAAAGTGLADALRHAMPGRWAERLVAWLADVPQTLLGPLAAVASFQGPACRETLERRVAQGCEPSVDLVRALGRCGALATVPWLRVLAEGERVIDGELARAALLALCDLGAPQALTLVRRCAENASAVHPVLGQVGGRSDAQWLLRELTARPSPETALALGLLGDLSAVRPLVAMLASDSVGEAAAIALHWITGADLTETVFEADEDTPATGDDAYTRLRPGTGLARRPGTEAQRIVRDEARWSDWLAQSSSGFRSGLRYRFGREYTARRLMESLAGGAHGGVYRQLAADELAIRHAAPRRLDLRTSTARQRSTLQKLDDWLAAHGEARDADPWALAAKPA